MIRAAALLLAFAAGGAAAQVTPLPKNLKIVPPIDDVPGSVRAFSGVWVGKWGEQQDTTLAVERIDGNKVTFVYSWGPGIRMSQNGGFQRVVGFIDDKGALRGTLRGNGAELIYRWTGEHRLWAEHTREGRTHRAVMRRP